jgi:hypothetical protein
LAQVTTTQRRTLTVLGGVVVTVALVLWLTRSTGGGDSRLAVEGRTQEAPATTTSSTMLTGGTGESDTASTDTTVPLVPLTTGVPVPDAIEAPPVTAAPSATPAAPRTGSTTAAAAPTAAAGPAGGGTAVTADGATMAKSPSGAVRTVDKAKGCTSATAAGWKQTDCGALRTSGTVLLWVVETKGKASRALVLKEQTEGRWSVVLSAADVDGTRFTKIGVHGEDVSGDGQPELVFGFHGKDSVATLSMDVVDATPAVVAHRSLARGVVQLAKGSITTWAAVGDGTYDQVGIRYSGGAYRASAAQRVAGSAVPASMI